MVRTKFDSFIEKFSISVASGSKTQDHFAELQKECVEVLAQANEVNVPSNEFYRALGQFRSKVFLIHKTAMDQKRGAGGILHSLFVRVYSRGYRFRNSTY